MGGGPAATTAGIGSEYPVGQGQGSVGIRGDEGDCGYSCSLVPAVIA